LKKLQKLIFKIFDTLYINRPPTTFPPRLIFTYRTLQYIWTVENDAFQVTEKL